MAEMEQAFHFSHFSQSEVFPAASHIGRTERGYPMAETKPSPLLSTAICLVLFAGAVIFRPCGEVFAQTSSAASDPQTAPAAKASAGAKSTAASNRRRARRHYVTPSTTSPTIGTQQQTVGPTPEQRRRDAQILAAQQAQSAETARQQAIVTGKVIKERQAQQDEPRIQDAPGPGSQPLPGQPAVLATQASSSSGIQDAPGPAQTLPQTPPPTASTTAPPATQPAPQ